MSTLWTILGPAIGSACTILGATLNSYFTRRGDGARLRATEQAQRRQTAIDCVSALTKAISAHRSAMWHVRDARHRLGDTDPTTLDFARRVEVTRDGIDEPLTQLALHVPELAQHADQAVNATYALRNSTDTNDLAALRQAAKDAAIEFRNAAGKLFAATGVAFTSTAGAQVAADALTAAGTA